MSSSERSGDGEARRTWRPRTVALLILVASMAVACGGVEPLAVAPAPSPTSVEDDGTVGESPTEAEGSVTVAYPAVPSAWIVPRGDDVAARDLAALWGLDLFRLDPYGQLRSGLVEDAEVGEDASGTRVRLELAEGAWTDGTPVTSADVVATLELLRGGPQARALAPLTTVDAPDDDTVVLGFDGPYERWPWLLASVGSVLPAHVLADGGFAELADGLPVTAGWYELVDHDPGRAAIFAAHPDGPSGAPAVARVEILFTPSFETALGLLANGTADVVAGHLALNPVGRARELDGIEAEAPLGGTWLGIDWRAGGALGTDRAARRAVAGAVDVEALVEGLLGSGGEVATSPVPGVAGGFVGSPAGVPPEPAVTVPDDQEVPAFTARSLQRDLSAAGGGLELVRLDPPRFVVRSRTMHDGALRVHRDPPRPTMVGFAGDDLIDAAHRVDAVGPRDAPAEFEALGAAARVLPLYRVGVAHAWSDRITGLRPSSWPGIGLWNVGEWRLGPSGGETGG